METSQGKAQSNVKRISIRLNKEAIVGKESNSVGRLKGNQNYFNKVCLYRILWVSTLHPWSEWDFPFQMVWMPFHMGISTPALKEVLLVLTQNGQHAREILGWQVLNSFSSILGRLLPGKQSSAHISGLLKRCKSGHSKMGRASFWVRESCFWGTCKPDSQGDNRLCWQTEIPWKLTWWIPECSGYHSKEPTCQFG